MNLFPFCAAFFCGGRNEQGFTPEFSFEKALGETVTGKKRGVSRDVEILRSLMREVQKMASK